MALSAMWLGTIGNLVVAAHSGCGDVTNNMVTFEGRQTQPWSMSPTAMNFTVESSVGLAYANVPPLNLRPGDKIAFDTS
eukprot:SAG11_NODE_14579_length_607_cov_0.809055_1_plen_78_part_01